MEISEIKQRLSMAIVLQYYNPAARSLLFARRNFFASKAAEPSGNYVES